MVAAALISDSPVVTWQMSPAAVQCTCGYSGDRPGVDTFHAYRSPSPLLGRFAYQMPASGENCVRGRVSLLVFLAGAVSQERLGFRGLGLARGRPSAASQRARYTGYFRATNTYHADDEHLGSDLAVPLDQRAFGSTWDCGRQGLRGQRQNAGGEL